MNKKYVLLLIGVVILFVLFIGVIALQKNQKNQVTPTATMHNSQAANHSTDNAPIVTFAPLSSSPKEAAQQFYSYYFSTPTNPLANGAYKTNPYLSQDFKDLLSSSYDNGNKPPLCPQNKRVTVTVGKEAQVYINNQYMIEETVSEASPGTKDLYKILLENNNGKWLVEDVNCIY